MASSDRCARFLAELDAILDGGERDLAVFAAEHRESCAACAEAVARRGAIRRVLASVPRAAAPADLDRAVALAGDPAELVRLELGHLDRQLAPPELDERVGPGVARPRRFVLLSRRRAQWRVAAAAAALAAVSAGVFRGTLSGGEAPPIDGSKLVLERRPLEEISPYWRSAVDVLARGAPRDL